MSVNQTVLDFILSSLRDQRADIIAQWAKPCDTSTRHFVVDNLLPSSLALKAYQSFPDHGTGFTCRDDFRERKRTLMDLAALDPLLSVITYALQSPEVLHELEYLTGISNLEPDPSLSRGGLSMMFKGDFLNPHIDNSHDAKRQRYRRLNLLYYVSPGWVYENGGNFELWDDKRKKPNTIVSAFNRFVVMETTKTSWHSVSEVLVDAPRCCISSYCYTTASPARTDYYHVTSFDGRPIEKRRKMISRADNLLRSVISVLSGTSRG